ncbi:hypothetical protein ILYODFUR_007718 [Ilyodon furcidens]|uniref:Secreted protein n=1 Tax=Ilyodon furcidens TaxID=33524 RepID=A0ABV0VC13_9TELE
MFSPSPSMLLSLLLKLDMNMIRCDLLASNCVSSSSLTLTERGNECDAGEQGKQEKANSAITWRRGVRDGGFTLYIRLLLFPQLPPDDVHPHTPFVVRLLLL